MTSMNPLPPQAYTKDTVVKAYQWLQSQPAHIHEIAKTPDILVSLYLKAKLNGESALERPSIQNFKNELKSLAGVMNDFSAAVSPLASSAPTHFTPSPIPPAPAAPGFAVPTSAAATAPAAPMAPTFAAPTTPAATNASTSSLALDARSQETLRRIRLELNLSSDSEALRVALALAEKKLSTIL